jgi:putative endonuclease
VETVRLATIEPDNFPFVGKNMNYVYLLQCADDTLYCGWTKDIDARLAAHNSGKGAKYTRSRLPVKLVYHEVYEDLQKALSREWHLKRLSREEKLKLIEASH